MSAPESGALEDLAARLKDVVVTLRVELEVSRNVFGSEIHYVFRDPITSMTHSFGPGDYAILAELDGQRTLEEIFAKLTADGVLNTGDETSYYRFFLRIHQSRLVNLPIPDHRSLYDMYQSRRAAGLKKRIMGFLFMQIPLCVPDGFLTSTVQSVRFLFSRTFFGIWCAMMAVVLFIVVHRWSDLQNPLPALFDQDNLIFVWFSLIGLKLWHELGHGYACKHFGGQVPEMGVFMIVGTPSAYVDVSSSWGFPDKKNRLIVSLAGMYFESLIALPALAYWALSPESALGGMAYQLFLLATIVTIGFNANPLMRFDGYFIMSDLVGIPNLRARAQQEVATLFNRTVLGLKAAVAGSRKRVPLLLAYGISASIYKVTLTLGICVLIATKFYWLGIMMMAFYLVTSLAGSLVRLFRHLLFAPETATVRRRGIVAAALLFIAFPVAVGTLEVGIPVTAKGVLEGEHQVVLRAPADGFVGEVVAAQGDRLQPGSRILGLENSAVRSREHVERARLDVAEATLAASLDVGGFAMKRARESLRADAARYDLARARAERLDLRAPLAGRLVELTATRRLGEWVPEGEPLGRIESGEPVVRLLLTSRAFADSDVAVGDEVTCRPVATPERALRGIVRSIGPLGTRTVRNEALTQLGGGEIAVRAETGEAESSHVEVLIEVQDCEGLTEFYGASLAVRLNGPQQSLYRLAHRKLAEFLQGLSTGS